MGHLTLAALLAGAQVRTGSDGWPRRAARRCRAAAGLIVGAADSSERISSGRGSLSWSPSHGAAPCIFAATVAVHLAPLIVQLAPAPLHACKCAGSNTTVGPPFVAECRKSDQHVIDSLLCALTAAVRPGSLGPPLAVTGEAAGP